MYKFLFFGIIVVSVDAFIYFLLTNYNIFSPEISKRISFIIGAIIAFIFNKNYVFLSLKKTLKEPIFFCLLYLFSFLINSFIHDLTYNTIKIKLIAFLLATITSTIVNFLGQKFIVFKK